ncbi:MAG TPA: class I tRNA ligase family protein, partial [Nitrososphaerales archaeon]|nr:class I tRNA ligase family protein [Nitrososphaerales archaeon]
SFERVSGYLSVMIQQASGLIRNGYAYRADAGVYFDVEKFQDFGKLSHQSRDELALRPLEISPRKRNQTDFSLWRSTTGAEQRWESPWGPGTPGWHIQDTAVSVANFGPQYDIHGGARELIYPHHEAEIAQAEALTGLKPFVRYWVHTGLLTTDGRKMSKSEGNVYYAHDLLRKHDVNSVRLYFAGLHHQRDVEFDEASIERMEEKYWEWRGKVQSIESRVPRKDTSDGGILTPFLRALDDDIDGSRAVKLLGSIVSEAARERDPRILGRLYAAIASASQILGVGLVKDAN